MCFSFTMAIPSFPPSLLHYKQPFLAKRRDQKTEHAKLKFSSTSKMQSFSTQLSLDETQESRRVKEALDVIFAPRTLEDDGNLWIQKVSTDPATTATIIKLEKQLNTNLRQQRVRETGICNIRRELYDQLFDELIREETIMLPERGLFLSKVKDELKKTLNAYKTLYESSIAYGIRKVLQVEKDKADKEAEMQRLKKLKDDTYECVKRLREKHNLAVRKMNEECEIERLRQEEEMEYLKTMNQKLKNQLEEVMMSMLE